MSIVADPGFPREDHQTKGLGVGVGASTCHLAKFSRKLHVNEENWTVQKFTMWIRH